MTTKPMATHKKQSRQPERPPRKFLPPTALQSPLLQSPLPPQRGASPVPSNPPSVEFDVGEMVEREEGSLQETDSAAGTAIALGRSPSARIRAHAHTQVEE